MSNETQHIPADVRERVAREVFTLDADWRREYWDRFRRDYPRQAQAYYDTADRILAILRTPRGEGEVWRDFLAALDDLETAANLWVEPDGPTAADVERLRQTRQRVIACARALAALRSEAPVEGEADALELIRWAETRGVALEPVAGNVMPPGTYACYVEGVGDDPAEYEDAGEPYMGPGILGAIRAARRGEGGGE